MAKKVTKQKQKQKQNQKVIVNISQPKTIRRTTKSAQQQPRQYLPLMPSFNINPAQPQSISELAKVLGMLIPKAQTESTLGSAIPKKEPIESEATVGKALPKAKIGELVDVKESSSLGDAIPSMEELPPKRVSPLKKFVQNIELGRMAKEDELSRENLQKRRNKKEMNEAREMEKEDIASIQLGLSRFNYVQPSPLEEKPIIIKMEKPLMKKPSEEQFGVSMKKPSEEQFGVSMKKPSEEQFGVSIENVQREEKTKRAYTKKKKGPRRNSREDLNARYEYYVGEPYKGKPMKPSAFKKLVQDMESK